MKLIDGDDLLEHAEVNGESEEFINKLDDYIKDAPTIEPERQKGEWIEIIDTDEFGEPYPCGVRCSECGFCSVNLDNFCPNCGAEMEE